MNLKSKPGSKKVIAAVSQYVFLFLKFEKEEGIILWNISVSARRDF